MVCIVERSRLCDLRGENVIGRRVGSVYNTVCAFIFSVIERLFLESVELVDISLVHTVILGRDNHTGWSWTKRLVSSVGAARMIHQPSKRYALSKPKRFDLNIGCG